MSLDNMITETDAREIFHDEYGDSVNFVTDEVIDYSVISNDMIAETSYGAGNPSNRLFKHDVYGVTVLVRVNDEWVRGHTVKKGLSEMFYSMDEAREHIESLKE